MLWRHSLTRFFSLHAAASTILLFTASRTSNHVHGFPHHSYRSLCRFSSSRRKAPGSQFPLKMTPNYFLIKSEPDAFSIQDLRDCPDSQDEWDGVRNYQARNIMRKMKKGDYAFFYHSSCKVPAIVGQAVVVREAAPDLTALDPNEKYYDPKSTADNCRWDSVRFQLDEIYKESITLKELKSLKESDDIIAGMSLFRNSRLSVQEVTEEQWDRIKEIQNIKKTT